MVQQKDDYQTLEITLTGTNNKTLRGVLNFTAPDSGSLQDEEEIYDSKGAATFVIVVILVYGLSIVLMIGSLAKKNMKLKDVDAEEKQIHRYLSQANDLREKGAKDNYRQLKKNIITQVINNKSPDIGPRSPQYNKEVGNKVLRSMLAVGSPTAAVTPVIKKDQPPTEDPDRRAALPRRVTLTSESESLLESDEGGFVSPERHRKKSGVTAIEEPRRDGVFVSGPASHSRSCVVTQQPGYQTKTSLVGGPSRYQPRTSITTDPPGVQSRKPSNVQAGAPADLQRGRPTQDLSQYATQQEAQSGRVIPRVVVSNPDAATGAQRTNNSRLKPLDIKRAEDNRLSSFEKDSKIICNVDGADLQDGSKKCKLTMDSDGNIWILQASPDTGYSSQRIVTPSPSISTPGSIGYESLASRTPSPLTPSPRPGRMSPGAQLRGRRAHSPTPYEATGQYLDPREPARSSTPKQSTGYCDDKHIPIKSSSNVTSGGRRSPKLFPESPEGYSYREAHRYDSSVPKDAQVTGSGPTASPNHSRRGTPVLKGRLPSPPPDTDEEELVQITTV